jgi:hypothetical protein
MHSTGGRAQRSFGIGVPSLSVSISTASEPSSNLMNEVECKITNRICQISALEYYFERAVLKYGC